MVFKVGDRVRTTDKCMGTRTEYHNVVGTVSRLRADSDLCVMFRPDVNIHGESQEWALFEDELTPLEDADYWRKKYQVLRAKVDAYYAAAHALREAK